MLLEINPINPQARLIQRVVNMLKDGGIISYPTDSGYGIGCDIFNQKAIKRLIQLKQRPANKPFTFMCSDLTHISEYAHVSNTAYRLLRKSLPGAYTFILPGTKLVPKMMMTKQKTIGIRVPANTICRMLIEDLGNPLVNTSLPENESPLSEAWLIAEKLENQVDLVIDGGPIPTDPSSMIDLTSDVPEVIREGKGDISLFL